MTLADAFAAPVRSAVRFRWVVLPFWILATIGAVLWLPSLGSVVRNDASAFLPASAPSVRAERLARPFVQSGSQTGSLVVVRATGPLTPQDLRATNRWEADARRAPDVVAVTPGALSADGQATTALVQFSPATDGGGSAGARAVAAVRQDAVRDLPPGVQGHVAGSLPVLVDQQAAAGRTAAWVGLLSALVILVVLAVAFGSVLAPLVALGPAVLALVLAGPLVAESTRFGVQISSLLQLLLTALVLGAGTDYGLFMLFRYKELLGRGVPPRQGVLEAGSRVGGTVVFSALTVVAALSSLLLASFGLYRGVGPGLAIGIVVVLLVDLTLLPALLAILGPAAFWPARPRPGWARPGAWGTVAARICRRPVAALLAGVLALACLAGFVLAYAPSGFDPGGAIAGSDSAAGQAVLARYFGVTQVDPTGVVLAYRTSVWAHPGTLAAAEAGLRRGTGLTDVTGALDPDGWAVPPSLLATAYRRLGPPQRLPVAEPAGTGITTSDYDAYRATAQFVSADGRRVLFEASLAAGSPGSTAAMQAVPGVRAAVARVARRTGATAFGVLGQAPGAADVSAVSGQDMVRVVPVVLVVLAALLTVGVGSLLAPLYLVVTVALSFLAALGLSVAVFELAGGALGVNFTLPFFLFVFVMALGEDYNILVVRRIREESAAWSPATAVTRAVAATGSTVTAAGLVLASTFGVLAFTTSGQVRQIGTGLALGVLLDTFVVRTLLVPSAVARLGRATWWPTRLWREQPVVDQPSPVAPQAGEQRARDVRSPTGALSASS